MQVAQIKNTSSREIKKGVSFLEFKRTSDTLHFPEQFAQYTRSFGDIYFWEPGNFHVVNNVDHAKEVLTGQQFSANRASFFISRMPNLDLSLIQDFFGLIGPMMVMSDGKQHQMRRKAAGMGINDHMIEAFTPKINKTVSTLLEQQQGKRSFEFVSEVARKLPSRVLADLFCIPEKDREFFFECSNTMTGFFGGAVDYTNEVGQKVNQAAIDIRSFFEQLIVARKKKPELDFISGMLMAQKKFGLSDAEIISQAVMMLVAGQVTTTDQICNNLFLLLSDPEIKDELIKKKSLIPKAMEEFKRFDPAVTFLFRVATQETVLGGQEIRKGDTVFVANHALGRDETEFERSHQLDIHRVRNNHFAYGHGPHYCLGARLGRTQMNILFSTLLDRFPKIRLGRPEQVQRDHYSLSFSGFKSLEVYL